MFSLLTRHRFARCVRRCWIKKTSIGDSTCLDAWSLIRTCMCLLGRVKRIVSCILNVQWSLQNRCRTLWSRNKFWHRMQIKVSDLGKIVASLTLKVAAVRYTSGRQGRHLLLFLEKCIDTTHLRMEQRTTHIIITKHVIGFGLIVRSLIC